MSFDNPIRHLIPKYKHFDIVRRDLYGLIQQYSDLRPKGDFFVFNDGQKRELIHVEGTIPVPYIGNTYNIPICVWLLETHPYNPPMAYVKPTSTMQIKPGKHVDTNGRVYLPYLHEWKHPSSDIFALVQIMIIVFGEESPVFSRAAQPPARPPYPGAHPTPYPISAASTSTATATPHGPRATTASSRNTRAAVAVSTSVGHAPGIPLSQRQNFTNHTSDNPHQEFAAMLLPDDTVKLDDIPLGVITTNEEQCRQFDSEELPDSVISDKLEALRRLVLPDDDTDVAILRIARTPALFWSFAMRYFKSSATDFRKHLHVQFLGEPAIDDGGPRREFLQLLLAAIITSPLLAGEPGKMMPKRCARAVGDGSFFALGKMIGTIIIQGGPAIEIFHPNIIRFILSGIDGLDLGVDCITDQMNRDLVSELNDASTQPELVNVLGEDMRSLLIECGVDAVVSLSNKNQVVKDICRCLIRDDARASYEEFSRGFATLKMDSFTKENPGVMYQILCTTRKRPLDADVIHDLFLIDYTGTEEDTPDLKAKELSTYQSFYFFTMELGNGEVKMPSGYIATMEDFLQCVTGLRSIPPGGLTKVPKVSFGPLVTADKRMPDVSTCDMTITLPMHNNLYNDFKEMMMECLAASGFGQP